MAQTNIPGATEKIDARSKDVPWYSESIGSKLDGAARDLLANYSKIPADQIEEHVYKIRDKAWQVWPYPCIGGFRFLDLAISLSPDYPEVLRRLESGSESFLDLGCCFGQELRKIAADGAPSENLYGSDLRPEFFDLGYDLFFDRDSLKSKFIAADIFDSSSPLSTLDGKIDIVYIGAFLHLFGYDEQVQICKRIVQLTRPVKGTMVLGRQVGNVDAAEKPHRTNKGQVMFQHNTESFQKMWNAVGDATATKWSVRAELVNVEEEFRQARGETHGPGLRRLRFTVVRE
ncbi:hypothetical protein BP6252_08984 [Coleophoma cylindrospora]|uniref:Methyltransferase domain-containing protein n=1 Tax=Coleophoma cylindrospora TaxID=1849047 RepID=A0A3D8R0V8_9HELO|nr:hypothetical protein BP6252_08984 [Coleophoma cylindrospora]